MIPVERGSGLIYSEETKMPVRVVFVSLGPKLREGPTIGDHPVVQIVGSETIWCIIRNVETHN